MTERTGQIDPTGTDRVMNSKRDFLELIELGGSAYEACLRGADLTGANLKGADLREANLGKANLSGANLGGAQLYE